MTNTGPARCRGNNRFSLHQVRVAPVAVRVPLTRERPRYAEEYGSELWEIAQVGGYWRPGGCAHGASPHEHPGP